MADFKNSTPFIDSTRFAGALFAQAERSRMTSAPRRLTTFNAGDIVPIYHKEILPSESISFDLDFIIRQTTLLTPTFGKMQVDIFAYFVPNRIVNQSWKAVMGENLSGSWTAPEVSLAPLVASSTGSVKVPVGSVADYYDYPTQQPIPRSVLSLTHDLLFRGYLMIYNEHFRDQNYQPPIPFSTLNVFEGFFEPSGTIVGLIQPGPDDDNLSLSSKGVPDGSFGQGAVLQAVYGSGSGFFTEDSSLSSRLSAWSALSSPLKANKLHDYFTSVLPSPQKTASSPVFAPVSGSASIPMQPITTTNAFNLTSGVGLRFGGSESPLGGTRSLFLSKQSESSSAVELVEGPSGATSGPFTGGLFPSNLVLPATNVSIEGLGISVNDLRMSAAIQQYYETLARGGSRYRSLVATFFGIEADNPYSDVPTLLGQITRDLDLYQTAQTSATESGSSPQGNLAAFGYTNSGGHLFNSTFLEHGYLHVFAVVRHKNVYSSYMDRSLFRLNALDYYWPQIANVSEQPVYTYQINPFASNPLGGFGYQEAFAEYRFDPDRVSGLMRPMPSGIESLSLWNYADNFDASIQIANGDWLKSNSQEVLDRTLAVTSELAPQFKAIFQFKIDKELPMPTYSVPGMDII